MPSDERDQQFERALARHLSGASGSPECPDAEILAAYHERSLSVEEMAHWKGHIAVCARCQEGLLLVEQTENVPTNEGQHQRESERESQLAAPAMAPRAAGTSQGAESFLTRAAGAGPAPVRKLKLRSRAAWSWIVPVGAVAAGVIVLISVREIRTQHAKQTQVALQRLPAPLPAAPQASARQEARKEEAPVAKTQNVPGAEKSAPSAPALQSPSAASPPLRKEVARSPRQESPSVRDGAVAALEPPPSASSYAASADALQTHAPPASSPAPPAPGAATPGVSAQHNEENKKAQSLKARVAPELQPSAAAPTMTSAEVVARANDNLAQTALTNGRYIVAPGEKHAWRLGDGGLIEVSIDRGKTWKPQSSGVTTDLTAGSAASDKVCWVVGKSGTLLLTVDGGKNWNQIASPISGDLGGVHATDESHASIWDVSNRASFETNDGGVTWQRTANE
jgi:Photosynthesis system II assembly factor YCF48